MFDYVSVHAGEIADAF